MDTIGPPIKNEDRHCAPVRNEDSCNASCLTFLEDDTFIGGSNSSLDTIGPGPPINHENPQYSPYPSSITLQNDGGQYNASFITSPGCDSPIDFRVCIAGPHSTTRPLDIIKSGNLPTPLTKPAPFKLASAKRRRVQAELDTAMRYIRDSDATPDRCTDPIWLLGLQYPGYDPSAEPAPVFSHRGSVDSKRASSSKNKAAHWSPEFYADFTSCVWFTYHFRFQPICDSSLAVLEREQAEVAVAAALRSPIPIPSSPPSKRRWPGGKKVWTSDTGWGCMLRKGQSFLATALIHLRLGRGSCGFDFPLVTSLTLCRLAEASPSRIYYRIFNIRPDFNVVFRLAIPALSVQRTPYGSSREGTW